MVTALNRYNGGWGLVFVMGAFAEMSGDVSRICNIIAHDLARTHVSYYNDDAKRTKGMYRQRIQKVWGHMAHRGWARLLLNRARDLIIHGPAHRGANGAAMPTDEGDQDGHFSITTPRERATSLPRRAQPCFCCLDTTLPLRGRGAKMSRRGTPKQAKSEGLEAAERSIKRPCVAQSEEAAAACVLGERQRGALNCRCRCYLYEFCGSIRALWPLG